MRLAELVAALSLGVDLGFGQPMEHVLRQCLIALRLAGQAGLGERDRMAVYYTALLVNVGCHADAHEQAKWFGDDIALKSGKYVHELGSVRGTLAAVRLVGAGNPPLHRFRVGLGFAFSGHRQLDGMISQHARLARTLAGQLELPGVVLEWVGAAYEQWDGRGWPGTVKAGAIPVAARIAQLAEFTEVAHRVGGVAGATALARRRAGRQFDPALAALLCSHAEEIFGGLEAAPAWRTVIAAGPGRSQDSDRVRHVPTKVKRPGRGGRHQAALLVPDHPEGILELGDQRRGVIRQASHPVMPPPGTRARSSPGTYQPRSTVSVWAVSSVPR